MNDRLSVTYAGVVYTLKDLGELPMSELLRLYNQLSDDMRLTPVERFATKAVGMKRTWDMLLRTLPREPRGEVPPLPAGDDPEEIERVEDQVKETLATQEFPGEVSQSAPPVTDETVASGKKRASSRQKREMYFVFRPLKEIKAARPGTLRHGVLEKLLSEGMLFSEVVDAVKAFDETRRRAGVDMKGSDAHPERRAYEVVRLIHYYLGYGLRQDPDGRIHAYVKE